MTESVRKNPRPGRHRRRKMTLRRNVGLVIINDVGQVLGGLRQHANGDKAWQLPQGGIEGREAPLAAAYREMTEETGLQPDEVAFVMELPIWTVYYLPKEWGRPQRRFAGQKQKWFLFKYLGKDLPVLARAKDKEFSALDWLEPVWLVGHVIDFRKPVYSTVFEGFKDHLHFTT